MHARRRAWFLRVVTELHQEHIEPRSGEGAHNCEIAKFKHGRWELKLVAALCGYSGIPTCELVKLTSFGNRYAITLRATQLSQNQPLCIGGQCRGPLLAVYFWTRKADGLSMRRNCTDIEPLLLEGIRCLGVVSILGLHSLGFFAASRSR